MADRARYTADWYILIIISLIILLDGCATPNILRNKDPFLTYVSHKSTQELAMCITDRWENLKRMGAPAQINMRPTEQGFIIYHLESFYGYTMLLVDIVKVENGTILKYWKHLALGEKAFDEAVVACQ